MGAIILLVGLIVSYALARSITVPLRKLSLASREKVHKQQMVKIVIQDSGSGISAEDLPHIFDHFYRADKSRNRKSGGSGIGLAIVKRLVEIHGGTVHVDSKAHEGSKFCIYLPVSGQ